MRCDTIRFDLLDSIDLYYIFHVVCWCYSVVVRVRDCDMVLSDYRQ